MAEHQGPRRHAACKIIVNGDDVTSVLFPYLISVQVKDDLEGGMDEAHIELDDRNAELAIPPDNSELSVQLGWAGEGPRLPDLGRQSPAGGQGVMLSPQEMGSPVKEAEWGGPGMVTVFDGWVTSVESGFGRRGGGRRLWIDAKGFNDKGPGKEIQKGFLGEGTQDDSQSSTPNFQGGMSGQGKVPLKDMMTKVFGAAGLSVAMSPEMEKVTRDYWHINDSPMNFGKRIADEVGGLFKISKKTAILVGKIEGVNADGETMPTVDAVWGINLIGWRIKPYVSRPQYGNAQSRHFQLWEGLWKDVKGAIGGSTPFGGTQAIQHAVNSVADQAQGEQNNQGASAESSSQRGTGWVLINGEPNAKANGFLTIQGARPGIDGTYTMTEVEHNYTRGVGYTTRANLKQPVYNAADFKWVQDGQAPQKGEKITIAPDGSESYEPDPVEEWEARQAREREARRKAAEEAGEEWQPDPADVDQGESFEPAVPPVIGPLPLPPVDPGEDWHPPDFPPEPGEDWQPDPNDPAQRPPQQEVRPPAQTGGFAGERTYTAKEMEEIRNMGTELPAQPAPTTTQVQPSQPLGGERTYSGQDLYQSGQGGEGGITFPQ